MKDFAAKFYTGRDWRRVSQAYMHSKFYICEICGRAAKICHHRTWLTPDNIGDINISLNPDNLQCLCQDCHNKIHSCVSDNIFSDDGDLLAIDSKEQQALSENNKNLDALLKKLNVLDGL